MTKKSFLALVSAVLLVLMLAACGNNDKNKEESENTNTGDTDTTIVPDTDPADTGDTEIVPDEEPAEVDDTEIVPDEENTDADDTDDSELFPDIDMDDIPQDGSCTISHSFGTNYFTTRDIEDIGNICADEIAGERCYASSTKEQLAERIGNIETFKLIFHRDTCHYSEYGSGSSKVTQVECPDFIPKSLKFKKLTGCEYFTPVPYTDCLEDCPHFYFSTDNDFFRNITYINSESSGELYLKLKAESYDGTVDFTSNIKDSYSYEKHFFAIREKMEDGTYKSKGRYYVTMNIVTSSGDDEEDDEELDDSDQIPAQCEDYEDRLYTEGDLIPDGCGILICSEEGWISYGNLGCYDECDPDGVLEIRYWDCPNGEELEWCICEADEEYGSIWSCINRVDLTCPAE